MSLDDLIRSNVSRDNRIKQLKNLEEMNDLASRVRDFMDYLREKVDSKSPNDIFWRQINDEFESAIFNADKRRHHYLIVKGPKDCYYNDPMASLPKPTPCDCDVCNGDIYEIIHDPDCGRVWESGFTGDTFDGSAPIGGYERFTCAVEWQIDNIGYEDFQDLDLEPGKYEIRYYFNWSGSMFDDAEQYIEVVSDKLPLEDNAN